MKFIMEIFNGREFSVLNFELEIALLVTPTKFGSYCSFIILVHQQYMTFQKAKDLN